jgi:eukaryotic-like serine/threonine-protein kinase
MQLLRDDSYGPAELHFRRAVELDPAMALAHLRIAVSRTYSRGEDTRREFAKAAELRGQLDDRDRVLLDAMEPSLGRTAPDDELAITRLQAAHERFPFDAEFLELLAEFTVDDAVRGPTFAREATVLDPGDASGWELLGRGLVKAGDLVGGRRALERCAAVSVESSDCFSWLAALDGSAGRCSDMEHDATRSADVDAAGNRSLARALAALGRPEAMVREAMNRGLMAVPSETRPLEESRVSAGLDSFYGRFDEALRALDAATKIVAADRALQRDLSEYGPVESLRVNVLREIGDETAARSAARRLADRLDLLTRGGWGGTGDLGAYWWVVRAAGLPLDPGRREWTERRKRSGRQDTVTWIDAWALPATTREEALVALTSDAGVALPRAITFGSSDYADAAAGHVLALAGRPADAIPYFRRAAQQCFALEEPFAHFHAALDLGLALEQTSDKAGACDAYGKVLAQWGHAKPKSVTADEARAHATKLGCPN